MAFGLNRAEVIGRLGADVTINHLASGGRVANLSIATDESYIDKQTGERVDRTEVAPGRDLPERAGRYVREARPQGPAGLRRRQAPDPALEEGRRGQRSVLDRDPAGPGWACPILGQAQRQRRHGAGRRGDPARRVRSRRSDRHRRDSLLGEPSFVLSLLPATGGRRFGVDPLFCFLLRVRPRPGLAPALRAGRFDRRRRREAAGGRYRTSPARPEESCHAHPVLRSRRSFAMNAGPSPPPPSPRAPRPSADAIFPTAAGRADTGSRATSTAPAGAPSTSGSPAPARLVNSPTRPQGSMATSSTSSVTACARRRCARRSTRPAPSSPCRLRRRRAGATPTTPPKRPVACGGAAAPSTGRMPKPISRRGVSRAAGSRRCASTLLLYIGTAAAFAACLRSSPPSPATRGNAPVRGNTPVRGNAPVTAPSAACSVPGSIRDGPPKTMLHTAPPLYGRGHTRGSAVVAFAPAVWSAGVRESQIGNGPARYRRVHAEARTCAIC